MRQEKFEDLMNMIMHFKREIPELIKFEVVDEGSTEYVVLYFRYARHAFSTYVNIKAINSAPDMEMAFKDKFRKVLNKMRRIKEKRIKRQAGVMLGLDAAAPAGDKTVVSTPTSTLKRPKIEAFDPTNGKKEISEKLTNQEILDTKINKITSIRDTLR